MSSFPANYQLISKDEYQDPFSLGKESFIQEDLHEQIENLDEEIVIDDWKVHVGELILKVAHLALGILRLLSSSIKSVFSRKKSGGIGEYCFTQQFNDSCHISPLQNLKILKSIREVGYDLSKVDFYSRRQWLGENQKMLTTWHQLMTKLCREDSKENYPNIYEYLSLGIEKGPVSPHFYDQNGKIPFNGLKGAIEFGELPFFFIDVESLEKVRFQILCTEMDFGEMMEKENLGLKTGMVNDKGVYKLYNSETREFVPIENLPWIHIEQVQEGEGEEDQKSVIKIDRSQMTEEEISAYPLPPEGYEIVMKNVKGLGFKQFGVVNELGGGFKLQNQEGETHTYIPYQMSLCKLLFLTSGIDEKNNPILEGHPLYQAKMELQKLMAEDPDNLWHPDNLPPEQLMQYQLAEIFKEDPELFRQAKGVVDVFTNNWLNYKKVQKGKFRNAKGEVMDQRFSKDYLLGKEQAVAYYFMQSIRMGWYSAINPEVCIKSMEVGLPEGIAPIVHQYLVAKLKTKHKIKLSTGQVVKESFLSVWNKILESLDKRTEGKSQDFMSFDDHGWVVSRDKKLIEMQNEGNVHDKKLLQDLGIAGIESWWGSELNLWYKKEQKKVQKMPEPQQAPDLKDLYQKV